MNKDTALKVLVLPQSGNKYCNVKEHVGELLKNNQTLTELGLNHYHFGLSGLKHIIEKLIQNKDTKLKTLSLNENDLGDQEAQYIFEKLEHIPLTTLRLNLNKITDVGAQCIGAALKQTQTLKTLELGCNNFTSTGVRYICDGLMDNQILERINLSDTGIEDNSIVFIKEMLLRNKAVKILDLSCNKITAEGAKCLGEALKANTTLAELNLSANCFGTAGIIPISSALKVNKTLTKLNLFYTNFGKQDYAAQEEALLALLEAVEINGTLKYLDCSSLCPTMSLSPKTSNRVFEVFAYYLWQGSFFEIKTFDEKTNEKMAPLLQATREQINSALFELTCCASELPAEVIGLISSRILLIKYLQKARAL